MRLSTAIVTSLAAACFASGGYWLGLARASRPVAQPPATESSQSVEPVDRTSNLVALIEQLNRRLAAVELKQLNAQPPKPSVADPPLAAAAAPLDPEAIKKRQLESAAAIEAALRTEPRDGAWAPGTENQLRTAVDTAVKEGAQYSLKALRCLTSLCEMVLSAQSPEQLGHMQFELVPRLGNVGRLDISAPQVIADGSATVTFKLFRKGYAHPDEGT